VPQTFINNFRPWDKTIWVLYKSKSKHEKWNNTVFFRHSSDNTNNANSISLMTPLQGRNTRATVKALGKVVCRTNVSSKFKLGKSCETTAPNVCLLFISIVFITDECSTLRSWKTFSDRTFCMETVVKRKVYHIFLFANTRKNFTFLKLRDTFAIVSQKIFAVRNYFFNSSKGDCEFLKAKRRKKVQKFLVLNSCQNKKRRFATTEEINLHQKTSTCEKLFLCFFQASLCTSLFLNQSLF